MLRLRHVYKTYQNDHHVLRDLNFEITKPGLHFITGESGSGKTTLFKLLTAQARPTSGEIFFENKNISNLNSDQISAYRKNIGIIFQDYKLISDLSIYENIILPLKIQKKNNVEISHQIGLVSEKLNLKNFLNEYPEHISGGQQQQAALARALIHNPHLIIADEPTGNLDTKNSSAVIETLSDCADGGALVLIATHDQNILRQAPEKIFKLISGQLST